MPAMCPLAARVKCVELVLGSLLIFQADFQGMMWSFSAPVLRRIRETGGVSLVDGARNLMSDLEAGRLSDGSPPAFPGTVQRAPRGGSAGAPLMSARQRFAARD